MSDSPFKVAEEAIREVLAKAPKAVSIPEMVESAKGKASEADLRSTVWNMIDSGELQIDQQYGVALNGSRR